MDPAHDDEYLLPGEPADLLGGVHPKTLSRWAREGKLPYQRTLGGHRRYPAAALQGLAATLGYQPEAGDAPDGVGGPPERSPVGGFPSDPYEPLPDPRP